MSETFLQRVRIILYHGKRTIRKGAQAEAGSSSREGEAVQAQCPAVEAMCARRVHIMPRDACKAGRQPVRPRAVLLVPKVLWRCPVMIMQKQILFAFYGEATSLKLPQEVSDFINGVMISALELEDPSAEELLILYRTLSNILDSCADRIEALGRLEWCNELRMAVAAWHVEVKEVESILGI